MASECALYHGVVRHRRRGPSPHTFSYRLFMVYLDLAQIDAAFAGHWLWRRERWAPASFRRADYLGPPALPLDEAVRQRVESVVGQRPRGPVRLLTHLRYWGHAFNPVTFYYCFAPDGQQLDAVVAEITNTPWRERHAYVLPASADRRVVAARFDKAFHVSPFQSMQQQYDWRLSVPGDHLAVGMRNWQGGEVVHTAMLSLHRRPWSARNLRLALLQHPWMTLKVIAGIHWQAGRLWWRRARFHAHPRHAAVPAAMTNSDQADRR